MVDFKKKLLEAKMKSTTNLKSKFGKRDQTVLDKTYKEKDERSKASGMGKSIFNKDLLEEFGLVEFTAPPGDHFKEILPISYDPSIPYFLEVPVHYGVGFSKDAFICLHRWKNKKCYRCEQQKNQYNKDIGTKDSRKKLFPTDRPIYLMWDRTKELMEGESINLNLEVWAAPKAKVHSEIVTKARNKINRTNIDISDVSDGGEGRTVSFSITKEKGEQWPKYTGVDLSIRENSIPEEVLEILDHIITTAEVQGFDNCIDMLLYKPTYEEVKESMDTEDDNITDNETSVDDENSTDDKKASTKETKKGFSKKQQEVNPEDEIIDGLDKLSDKLLSMNRLQFKIWCKQNDYEEAIGIADPNEAVAAIIDDMYEKHIDTLHECGL